jgi:hypothetical protein
MKKWRMKQGFQADLILFGMNRQKKAQFSKNAKTVLLFFFIKNRINAKSIIFHRLLRRFHLKFSKNNVPTGNFRLKNWLFDFPAQL